jgi:ABC-type dipeptide/oligopeptide/nickel transport system ATPase component
MQHKIVKALEEVRELNSQITSMQGIQHTISSIDNNLCKGCRGGIVMMSPSGKNVVLESGKKKKPEAPGTIEDSRGRQSNTLNQKMVLKRSNIVSTSSCQCQCLMCT